MIGLLHILPPPGDGAGTEPVDRLPPPPAARFSAFAVRCGSKADVGATLHWYRTLRGERPAVALGLVCRPDHCVDALSRFPHPLTFVRRPGDLAAGGLARDDLDRLRDAAIEGRILAMVVDRYGAGVLEQEATLKALIARACAGGSVAKAAADLGVSPQTVRRRLARVGVRASRLRAEARVWSYRLRVDLGVRPAVALLAAGWSDHEARRKAKRRLGEVFNLQ